MINKKLWTTFQRLFCQISSLKLSSFEQKLYHENKWALPLEPSLEFIVDDSSSFCAQNSLILSFSSSFSLQTQRFENYIWSMGKVSSLTLRPESSHRSNINGSRNTRGNDAILYEYYYIKVSNTIEKKKREN